MLLDDGAGFIDRALAGEFAGTTVTMLGPITDEDEVKLNATVAEFEAATGIDLVYEGTKEFEAIVTTPGACFITPEFIFTHTIGNVGRARII